MAQPISLENPMLAVWSSELDGRYLCEVQRVDDRTATFYIFDKNESYKELFSRRVPLMYGAPFGPDVEDVARWEEMGVEFVDKGKVEEPAPITLDQLKEMFTEEFNGLHQMIHEVGMNGKTTDDPDKLLRLVQAMRTARVYMGELQ